MSDRKSLDLDAIDRILLAAEADAPGRYVIRLSPSYEDDPSLFGFGHRPPSLPERPRRDPPKSDINGPCSYRATGSKRSRRRRAAKATPPLTTEQQEA